MSICALRRYFLLYCAAMGALLLLQDDCWCTLAAVVTAGGCYPFWWAAIHVATEQGAREALIGFRLPLANAGHSQSTD